MTEVRVRRILFSIRRLSDNKNVFKSFCLSWHDADEELRKVIDDNTSLSALEISFKIEYVGIDDVIGSFELTHPFDRAVSFQEHAERVTWS
jgi:hypothetical protein